MSLAQTSTVNGLHRVPLLSPQGTSQASQGRSEFPPMQTTNSSGACVVGVCERYSHRVVHLDATQASSFTCAMS